MRKLTGQELKQLREEKFEYYRQIKKVILPEPFSGIKVFIGGCITRGVGSSFRHQAHAHNHKKDPNFNTICIRSIKRIGKYHEIMCADGIEIIIDKLSQLMLHEIAHILTPNHGHDKKWLNKYIEIGASSGQVERAKRHWKMCN